MRGGSLVLFTACAAFASGGPASAAGDQLATVGGKVSFHRTSGGRTLVSVEPQS